MAAGLVKQQKLMPISISPAGEDWGTAIFYRWTGKVTPQEVTNFTRQLSTMVTSGLPITDALSLLKVQSATGFTPIVGAILADVQGGVSLSEAMSRYPSVFSRVYVALVKAGEAAGVMETVLDRLAGTMEKSREFTGKVVAAMIYPIIVVLGMIVVTIIMIVVVIPKLTSLYKDFGAQLPWPTQLLLWVSDFTTGYWWLILIVVGGVGWGVSAYIKTTAGKSVRDDLIYKMPIMGKLARQMMLTELTRTLGLLISAGVPVVEALNIVSATLGNVNVEKDVRRIAKQVEKGFPVSISFSESQFFPAIMGQMIAVGEETGKMDEVLSKLASYFEVESEQSVKGLTAAIEPLIIMVLAVGVGFLMYAVIMPIYDITNKI